LKRRWFTKEHLKAYKHTWEAGTDVHEGVMLDSRFSSQVTQNEDNGRAIGFCWKNPGQHYQKVQILLKYYSPQESINFNKKFSCQKAAPGWKSI